MLLKHETIKRGRNAIMKNEKKSAKGKKKPHLKPVVVHPFARICGSNLYATLHVHKVDDRTLVKDGAKPLPVPAGWNIAPGDADDVRVCGAHPWQSTWLVFADNYLYGTAMCNISSFIGTQPQLQNLRKFFSSKFSSR